MNDPQLALLQARIAIALVGALLFGYGVRVDSPAYRWAGIGMFAVALVLRWWKPGPAEDADGPPRQGGEDAD